MQYLTTALALLSTSLLVSGAPAPHERRSCSIAYPRAPGFPINYDIGQEANGANAHKSFLTFNSVPKGAYGCQLEVHFPAGYPITSSGNAQLEIRPTYGEHAGSLFGTVTLASSPVADTKYVVNSAPQCAELMTYEVGIASKEQAGRVAFAEVQDAGFVMTYNC